VNNRKRYFSRGGGGPLAKKGKGIQALHKFGEHISRPLQLNAQGRARNIGGQVYFREHHLLDDVAGKFYRLWAAHRRRPSFTERLLQLRAGALDTFFRREEVRKGSLHLLNKVDRVNKTGRRVTEARITNFREFRLREEGPLRRTPLRYREHTLQEAGFLRALFRR
jgi:hypothetical protein